MSRKIIFYDNFEPKRQNGAVYWCPISVLEARLMSF